MDKNEVLVKVNTAVFELFDAVSLVAGISSLILAVIAIWLTLHFKKGTDDVNMQTKELLIEIRAESKQVSEGIMSELKEYGRSMRGGLPQNTASTTSYSSQTENFHFINENTISGDTK